MLGKGGAKTARREIRERQTHEEWLEYLRWLQIKVENRKVAPGK